MASYSDEESLGEVLDVRMRQSERAPLAVWSRRALLASVLAFAAFMAGHWGSSAFVQRKQEFVTPADQSFEQKIGLQTAAVMPSEAMDRNEKRQRLVIEEDLKTVLHEHISQRQSHFQTPGESKDEASGASVCAKQANRLFDDIVEESALGKELDAQELEAFKQRFESAMKQNCKDLISERLWLQAAGRELEQQKPVMTAAMATSLNGASLGFQAKMHEWLLHESVETFQHHLGLLPTPKEQRSVLKRKASGRQAEHLPSVFRAELKWPMCKEEILRIHNQGHCGSCWAFGGLASVDARMCIASNGKWDSTEDILSRLHVTSCAPALYWPGHDGCQGGFPHWPMEMMARQGVASSSCLPYYISGEGSEHFQQQDAAPPCESHCQGGYSLPLRNDTFSSAGVANYDWITHVHGDPAKVGAMKTAIYQEGPIAFAFAANHAFMGYTSGVFSICTGHDQANHAVYAFGWGVAASLDGGDSVEYFEASNSWGRNWGANGHFRIHPRCVTDATIPGTIESTVVNHRVGNVDSSVPLDPDNEYWPWPAPDECLYSDGCVTDMEGSGDYRNNEKCVSKRLNGKALRVEEFDTELGYDTVTINDQVFSGKAGNGLDLAQLEGMVVDHRGIRFQSDLSLSKAGFKLCG